MKPPLAAIFLLSAATLAYEVLLTRLFALILWHHYAQMIISLALLGFAVSGTVLAAFGPRLARRLQPALCAAAAGFGLTATAAFLLAAAAAVNPLELGWSPQQPLRLLATYLLLALPFLCAGGAIGLALVALARQRHRLYAADLLGAGSGALAVVGLLEWASPGRALLVVSALGLLAAALFARAVRWRLALATLALALAGLPAPALAPTPYKALARALPTHGTRVLAEVDGPQGRATALVNEAVPFRDAPGLSLTSPFPPSPQIALFLDGEPAGGVPLGDRRYLRELPSAAAYALRARPRTLVFGLGTAAWQAQELGAASLRVVEANASLLRLVDRLPALTPLPAPLPERVLAAPRAFLAAERETYELVVVTVAGVPGGLAAVREDPLLTVEGMRALLARLTADGWLALSVDAGTPPRELLKLVATLRAALGEATAQRLALVRSFRTATLLVKAEPLSAADAAALAAFCAPRGFDLDHPAGLAAGINPRPDIVAGLGALLGTEAEAADFRRRYRFELAPATDERPYFFHFFRADSAAELFARRGAGGLALLDWGYFTLWATFLQAALLAAPLLLPGCRRGGGVAVFGYFAAIGLGFMAIEIAFLQQFVRFLGHPVYAVAVVLATVLAGAGLGALSSPRFAARPGRVVLAILVFAAIALVLLPRLPEALGHWPLAARMAVAALVVAPLAFFLGMPFPLGLAALGGNAAATAWAWAVNGAASVIGAVGAQLVAVHFGFSAVVLAAAALYLLAWAGFSRLGQRAMPAAAQSW